MSTSVLKRTERQLPHRSNQKGQHQHHSTIATAPLTDVLADALHDKKILQQQVLHLQQVVDRVQQAADRAQQGVQQAADRAQQGVQQAADRAQQVVDRVLEESKTEKMLIRKEHERVVHLMNVQYMKVSQRLECFLLLLLSLSFSLSQFPRVHRLARHTCIGHHPTESSLISAQRPVYFRYSHSTTCLDSLSVHFPCIRFFFLVLLEREREREKERERLCV